MNDAEFKALLQREGQMRFRAMPWRDDTRPYYVLVSELMLQQTQVSRVIPKFQAFIERFPDERALARASLADVLVAWQGLGYNRRAKYLHEAVRLIVERHGGEVPATETDLLALPGIGVNTAGAIRAYAFNHPSIFIETNIRTVYIHHFFADAQTVPDQAIRERLTATLNHAKPRQFYWALMDYGAWLKASGVRNNTRSHHYRKQPPLEGSIRQVRGRIVTLLAATTHLDRTEAAALNGDDTRFLPALEGLLRDGLVAERDGRLYLTK